jgi:GNAT superfamily N-acetyltransferase
MDADVWAERFSAGIAALAGGDRPGEGYLAASDDGTVVGYAVFGPYRWDDLAGAGEVYALYVDPDVWGGGAGRALLRAAEARLRALGHHEAALWVLETNRLGRGFYEALGWSADGAQAALCELDDAVEVRYRRTLTPPSAHSEDT